MTDSSASSASTPVQNLAYTGRGARFYVLYIKMWLLMMVTLGIYRFWGRTNVRRYIWSNVKFLGEPFAYLGTGRELFKSAVKFVFLLFLPGLIVGLMTTLFLHGKYTIVQTITKIIFAFALYIFFYAARFMGLRYRLGRTSWRGIRFELRGSAKAYMVLKVKNMFLNLLSLGLYRPIGDVETIKFAVNKIHFGSMAFSYRGKIEELQKTYYLCWLLLLPTLGMSMFWYRAKYVAHIAKYTNLGNLQFRLKFEGGQYLRFCIGNVLLILFTLGLAYPFVKHRRARFYLSRVRVRGVLDENAVTQAGQAQGAEGAELSLGFDDFGF